MLTTLQICRATASAVAVMLLVPAAHAEAGAPKLAATGGAPATDTLALIRPACSDGTCNYTMSPAQLLGLAEKLVSEKKFEEARPLVAALRAAPGMELPYNFLSGLIALEANDPEEASKRFRAILENHPGQTRVRLELARALMMQGKFRGADYHLQLAQNDENLPEDIARMIGNARSVIRSNRKFRFGFEFGFAPDSNINSATNAETVDVNFGPVKLPIELDENARARSGLGITAEAYASLRLPTAKQVSMVIDTNAAMTNYEGGEVDDYTVQLAAGPEYRINRETSVTLQAVGLYRWYGGEVAARQYGSRLTIQRDLDRSSRIAVQLDGRRSESELNAGYTGWQVGANATYERVIGKSFILSGSVVARRDIMDFDPYSNKTVGVNLGIGGELPYGINAGLSGGVTYSKYDTHQLFFSDERREDTRFHARTYIGLRSLRIGGFSPSIEYQFQKVDSNYDFYASNRHRANFTVARYF